MLFIKRIKSFSIINNMMNMKFIGNRAAALLVFLVATIDVALAQNSEEGADDNDVGPIRYIVKFKSGSQLYNQHLAEGAKAPYPQGDEVNVDTMLLQYGRFLPKANAEVVYLDSEEDVRAYERMKDVEYVQRDTKKTLFAEDTPWGIERVAALSVSDEFVSNQKICIIDTGYDLGHEDLPGAPEVVSGYSGELSPYPWNQDGVGHGTHVAGTIAAIGGNDKGVVGVIRNAQANLYIVRVFNDYGNWVWGSILAAAADICADAGSNVINMSVGCNDCYSQLEEEVFQRLYDEENILSIAASGNAGTTQYSYPASYDSVVSVGATNRSNGVAWFSQHNDAVDLSAPGVDVKSTTPDNTYSTYTGTSMASPHVAGVAALIWSHHPELNNTVIRQALEATALDLGDPGRDDYFGHGLINASAAVEYLNNMTNSAMPTKAPSKSGKSGSTKSKKSGSAKSEKSDSSKSMKRSKAGKKIKANAAQKDCEGDLCERKRTRGHVSDTAGESGM